MGPITERPLSPNEYPSEEDIVASKVAKVNFGSKLSKLAGGRFGRGVLVLGFVVPEVALTACASSSAAQVEPAKTPTGLPEMPFKATIPAVVKQEEILPTVTSVLVVPTETATVTSSPTPTVTKEPLPTATVKKEATVTPLPLPTREIFNQEQSLQKVEGIIKQIKNPDPELVKKLELDPVLLDRDIKDLVWGADPNEPKSPISQGGFLPDTLMGIKEAIEKGNHDLARQRIDKVYPRVKNVITSKIVGPVVDQQLIPQEVMNEIDPEYHFHQKDRIGTGVSITKKEAFLALVKLWYGLPPAGK